MELKPRQAELTRRGGFFLLVLLTMAAFTWMFADLLWRVDFSFLKFILVIIFSLLTYPLAIGFWQSLFGLRAPAHRAVPTGEEPLPGSRSVAVNIPVYNEDIEAVLARLEVLYRSIERAGQLALFDFYILSDSNDPDKWIAEEFGWARLCRKLEAFDRVFYRRRRRNVHQKAGNLLNFCESWGRRYKYMVILDADSLMSGPAMVRLTARMEENPSLGILQTVPLLTRCRSRYGILQQFANRVYGPVFARGMAFWQGSKGNYWGHNAIIRVEPFIRHCALPDLPGRPPLGGKILSHDFVEAALMVRAGYEVRMDVSDEGSYEEGPADVLDSATRDRRWCQGNMQHFWLLFADNLHWGSKVHFVNGLFAYLGSCFWLLFMALSVALAFEWEKSELSLIAVEGTSPLGNLSIFQHAVLLFSTVLFLLLFPKAMSLFRIAINGRQRRRHGGIVSLLGMGLGEVVISTLLAPVMMVFHFRFVFLTLLGKGIGWASQNRGSSGLKWGPTARTLRLHTLAGLAILLLAILIGRDFIFWLSPIWAGLLFSVPMGVLLSRSATGSLSGAFIHSCEDTPEERELGQILDGQDLGIAFFVRTGSGFQNAVVDPVINAVHNSILRDSPAEPSEGTLPDPAFFQRDPGMMDRAEQVRLMESPESMLHLHELVWRLPEADLHPAWRRVLERYALKPIFSN